jgi:hypothetical protein
MTVPRFMALRAEWRRRPPAHWLLAAVLRYNEPHQTTPQRRPSVAELRTALSVASPKER